MIYAIDADKNHRIVSKGSGFHALVTSYLDIGEAVVEADEDGWIEWPGGDGCPVGIRQGYEVRYVDGIPAQYKPTFSDTKPEPPAWDGGGLPPVGCECEAKDDYSQWQRCRIAGVEGSQLWIYFYDDGYATSHIDDIDIRPIRSEEDRAVDEMVVIMMRNSESYGKAARALYRAGYRKAGGE